MLTMMLSPVSSRPTFEHTDRAAFEFAAPHSTIGLSPSSILFAAAFLPLVRSHVVRGGTVPKVGGTSFHTNDPPLAIGQMFGYQYARQLES